MTALAAALVGGVIGELSLVSASTGDRQVRAMTVLEVQMPQAFVDVGKKGFSLGVAATKLAREGLGDPDRA